MANNKDENVEEKVKEAQKAAGEAAKLAANIASSNYIGIAKNAMNLLKNKQFKRAMLMSLIQPTIVILVILLLAASLFGIFNAIKDTLIEFIGDVGSGLSDLWQHITDDYWIDLGETVAEDPETGEKYTLVEKYITDLDATGISLVDLGILGEADYANNKNPFEDEATKAKVEKYIAEFIRADVITQQTHKRTGVELIHETNQNKVDGSIYLFRTTAETPSINDEHFVDGEYIPPEGEADVSNTNYKQMTYIDYELFKKKINSENHDPAIRYNFSIDPDTEQLVIAEITKTITIENEELKNPTMGEWFKDVDGWVSVHTGTKYMETTYKMVKIDYKQYIAKYTMPYEFLINLCQITKNPEFVYHVALLARESKIILGVQDNITINRETTEVEKDSQYFKNSQPTTEGADKGDMTQTKNRTVIMTTTQTPVLRVEYADTWSFYEEFKYGVELEGESNESNVLTKTTQLPTALKNHHPATTVGNGMDGSVVPGSAEYWDDTIILETRTKTQTRNIKKTYTEAESIECIEKSKQFLGLLMNSNGECAHSDCYQEEAWKKKDPKAIECAKEAEFKRGGEEVEYRMPNTTETEAPLNNLLSGEEMLYALLQSNSSGYEDKYLTDDIKEGIADKEDLIESGDYESAYVVKMQGLVEHMQYLMNFPKNEDYEVKDLNFEELLEDLLEDDEEEEYEEGFNYGFWWPIPGYTYISSPFMKDRIHPIKKIPLDHNGIDIPAPEGTEVIATAGGIVNEVGSNPDEDAGLFIRINHGNGIESVYMHLSDIWVKEGQEVSQGQVIALSGNTGRSTGAHLHFGIRVNGTYVNPVPDYVDPQNQRPEKEEISEDTSDWSKVIQRAFSNLGATMTEEKVKRILTQIDTESNGDENRIQGIKDSNSGSEIEFNHGVCPWCPNSRGKSCGNTNIGHGLLQFIPSTFESCKTQEGGGNIFSGYAQICALIVNAETKNDGIYTHIGNGRGWSPK